MERRNLIGQQFGRLTVLEYDEELTKQTTRSHFVCVCSCGNTKTIAGHLLLTGHVNSCGCIAKEILIQRNTKHGMRHTQIYESWRTMKRRCNSPRRRDYKYYGGRGITYSSDWESFEGFYKDMGDSWFPNGTIERKDVNGNYCKENCCWITIQEQQRNKRNSKELHQNVSTNSR